MNKLMIVDDSSTMRKIIMRVLRQADIACDSIVEAGNGVEALEALTSNPDVELILSDVNMPEMNGIDLVKNVRDQGKSIPIIMITTEGGDSMREKAMDNGANGYVCKPFTPETIRSALEPHVG